MGRYRIGYSNLVGLRFTSFAVKPRTSGRGCKAMIARKNLINCMSSYTKNAKIAP